MTRVEEPPAELTAASLDQWVAALEAFHGDRQHRKTRSEQIAAATWWR